MSGFQQNLMDILVKVLQVGVGISPLIAMSSPVHTSRECDAKFDVTNSQQIIRKTVDWCSTSAKHSLQKQPCDAAISFTFAFAMNQALLYTRHFTVNQFFFFIIIIIIDGL